VHAFRFGSDPRATTYLGSGVVKAHVLNQFSMDEYQGDLRIASSTGKLPAPNTHCTLSVFAFNDHRLELKASRWDLANGAAWSTRRAMGTRPERVHELVDSGQHGDQAQCLLR
jgi:hypothetical protein